MSFTGAPAGAALSRGEGGRRFMGVHMDSRQPSERIGRKMGNVKQKLQNLQFLDDVVPFVRKKYKF
jgi:hypothetical protein